jgi:hypothetical protein
MRNLLAHGYFGVDLDIVWRTIRTNLPAPRRQVQQIMTDPGRSGSRFCACRRSQNPSSPGSSGARTAATAAWSDSPG